MTLPTDAGGRSDPRRWLGARSVIVMTVRDVMTRRLVTIGPETPCDEARRLMDEHRIRHLPVVAGGRLIGMVSDRDVRSAASGSPGPGAGRIMNLGSGDGEPGHADRARGAAHA
ncbi:MAG TPA: CBS domain-containing protein [Methylomirabilota bacterium]